MNALDNLWNIEVIAFTLLLMFLLFWLSFKGYRKIGMGKISALMLTIPTWLFLEAAILGKVSDCWPSATLKEELKARLSFKEFASLKPNGSICPLSYSYVKDGKTRWAGIVGENIDFGDSENLP